MSLPTITIVVCTYNRSKLLAGVLHTLCSQSIDRSCFEILVIDNNSKDDTFSVVHEFSKKYSNVGYHLERKQGLSHARNCGWMLSKGEYIGYIDDDTKVPEQWVGVARAIIEKVSPGVFGGPFYPFYNTPKPFWFKDCYGSHEPFKEARFLNKNAYSYIFGGNMFFRQDLLKQMGGFDPTKGMSGNKLAYSEETVLIKVIATRIPKEKIYFDPRLYVYHFVHPRKMKLLYNLQRSFIQGRYAYYYSNEYFSGSEKYFVYKKKYWFNKAVRIIRAFIYDLKLIGNRILYPYICNWIYERAFYHIALLGTAYEEFRHNK